MGDPWPTTLDVWVMPQDATAFDMVFNIDTQAQTPQYFGPSAGKNFNRLMVTAPNHLVAMMLADELTYKHAELVVPTLFKSSEDHISREKLQKVADKFDELCVKVSAYNDENANQTLEDVANFIVPYLQNPDMHNRRCDLDTLYHAMLFYEKAIVPVRLYVHITDVPNTKHSAAETATAKQQIKELVTLFTPLSIEGTRKSATKQRTRTAPYTEPSNPLAQTNWLQRGALDEDYYQGRPDAFLEHLCKSRHSGRGKPHCLGRGVCNWKFGANVERCFLKPSALDDLAPVAPPRDAILFELIHPDDWSTWTIPCNFPITRAYVALAQSGKSDPNVFFVEGSSGKRVIVNKNQPNTYIGTSEPITDENCWYIYRESKVTSFMCNVNIYR